jgi:chromosome segregation ATPase
LEAKEKELATRAETLEARTTEVDRLGAELDARADRIAVAEDELAARVKEVEEREALAGRSEEEISERERRISERETAVAGREAALDQTEAGVAEREGSFDEREADLTAREEALTAEREQLERDRADWEAIMTGAFSRLSELETDLVSSLSLAGMLKRELEGREANERRDRKAPGTARPEAEERRGSANRAGAERADTSEPVLAALESNGSSIPKGEAAPEQQVVESVWWARQLGRRKKV